MGKSSQRKGAAGERDLAALLSAAGDECQRGGSRSFIECLSGFDGVDSV